MALTVHTMREEQLAWVNQCYAEVDFVTSTLADYVAVADVYGRPAGIGRITPSGELGGMLVFPEFRGQGISKALITHLIAHAGRARLFCVPFCELQALYEWAGFRVIPDDPSVPHEVAAKYQWCMGHYPKPVLLMARAG